MELGPYLILGLLEGLVTAAVLSLMAASLLALARALARRWETA